MIKVETVLSRCDLALALRVRYGWGRGGRDPAAGTPADAKGRCDCSGYVAWALGLDRLQFVPAGGKKWVRQVDLDGDGDLDPAVDLWLGTAGIIADARGDRLFFEPIPRPELGALVVYAAGEGRPAGHVGVIVGGLPAEWDASSRAAWLALQVSHCASAHKWPRAIQVTGAGPWWRAYGKAGGTMFVRRVAR
jgi:cell wall-associated NlpC family hydrolase